MEWSRLKRGGNKAAQIIVVLSLIINVYLLVGFIKGQGRHLDLRIELKQLQHKIK